MRITISVIVLAALLAGADLHAAGAPGAGSEDLGTAIALFNSRRYPEASAALERIVAAQPGNAVAHHYLGRALAARNDPAALEAALAPLWRAVELEPGNAAYLGIFGGTSLQLAGRSNSISAATKGRDAMEKALTLDPDYLEAREGLFQFYSRAPWPLGSSAKATAQLTEIRKRNPDLATVLDVTRRTAARDYATAFQLCEEVLGRQSDNYAALYHFGRTASISGHHLERGLACLQKCLSVPPPSPASPSHSNVWQRIGNIHEQLQQPDRARAAYQQALELDPSNRQATDALAKLK